MQPTKSLKLSLSPFYLNSRRLSAMAGVDIAPEAHSSIVRNSAARVNAMDYAKFVAGKLLTRGNFPSLTSALLESHVETGVVAQFWDVITFSGIGNAIDTARTHNPQPATLRAEIVLGDATFILTGDLLTDHFYSGSTQTNLRGTKRLLLAGKFELFDGQLCVNPYIIGDLVDVTDVSKDDWSFPSPWKMKVRAYPDQIEAFAKVKDAPRGTAKEVAALGQCSEDDVKNAFAKIIQEPFVPKDWGGEKSDLQTNHVNIEGETSAAAFMFKGPGVKGELHPNRLGKRGDQLVRAFDKPVDLIVIQHHNKIANTVVRQAESLASNPARPRRYCIIDGADTVRILKAYSLFPPPSASESTR